MRLKKNLSEMVKTDYVPLTTTQEGNLQGGFGSIALSPLGEISGNNVGLCSGRNPQCINDCPNPSCQNQCSINYCIAPEPSPSPKPTTSTANFLIGI